MRILLSLAVTATFIVPAAAQSRPLDNLEGAMCVAFHESLSTTRARYKTEGQWVDNTRPVLNRKSESAVNNFNERVGRANALGSLTKLFVDRYNRRCGPGTSTPYSVIDAVCRENHFGESFRSNFFCAQHLSSLEDDSKVKVALSDGDEKEMTFPSIDAVFDNQELVVDVTEYEFESVEKE